MFEHLLNEMEMAAQSDKPYTNGYANKRKAVLDYVADLEKLLEEVRYAQIEHDHYGCSVAKTGIYKEEK